MDDRTGEMDDRTKGAWIIHHANKLQLCSNQNNYNNTFLAGKAGILLSSISSEQERQINNNKLHALARAANINTVFELPRLIEILKGRNLIDVTTSGIAILGVTTSTILTHTSNLFDTLDVQKQEKAALALSEKASFSPVLFKDISEYLSDKYEIKKEDIEEFTSIGFVDTEPLEGDNKLLFNGNLFRRNNIAKVRAVFDSLKQEEQDKLQEVTELLHKTACINYVDAERILGSSLLQKVSSIGLFDISVISNSTESVSYLTSPSSFGATYCNPMIDDAFDLAKAFVSSITYGMTKSTHSRGKIRLVEVLLQTLINGERIGPVNAIKEDYKILELKGVVEVTDGYKNNRYGPMLKLIKKEVGQLALQVITQGDVNEHALNILPTAAATHFSGPEINRQKIRRNHISENPNEISNMLNIIRTGGSI